MGLEAQLGDEVGQELVEDSFSRVERLGDISMSVEEVLDCITLELNSDLDQGTYALDQRSSAVLDSFRLALWVP